MERRWRQDPPTVNRRRSLWRTMSTSAATTSGDTAKAIVAEQISQTVQSTSNLLHLMRQSSPAQAKLVKLPKNLLAKVSTIKNTEQVIEQLPRVISTLDAHMENGLQNVPQLKTVVQLLANMESSQLSSLSRTHVLDKVLEQLPRVISTLDAHMENGLQNVPQLKTVVQLLANMESSQLSSLSRTHVLEKEHESGNQSQGTD